MTKPLLLAVLFAVLAGNASAAPAPVHVDSLAWMSGSWASDSAGTRIEEHWMAPLGGEMVGMHRDVVRGRAVSFEFFRIVADSQGVAYMTSPRGRPALRFGLKELSSKKVVFENARHDFPQRILYWLGTDGRLHARIEGTMRGETASEDWVWSRSALVP